MLGIRVVRNVLANINIMIGSSPQKFELVLHKKKFSTSRTISIWEYYFSK